MIEEIPEIDRPSVADFDELTEVWEASVRATHHFLSEADIDFFKPLVRNEYLGQVELYVLRGKQGRVVAFMGICSRKLEMLFVYPGEKGKGLGRKLLEYAVRYLDVRYVDVNEQNGQAVGFYEYLGFEVISRDERDGQGKPFPILHLKWKSTGL